MNHVTTQWDARLDAINALSATLGTAGASWALALRQMSRIDMGAWCFGSIRSGSLSASGW
jgi:hypothetical protein